MFTLIKLDANDQPLPADATDWAAVHAVEAGLIWSKDDVAVDDLNFADATAACAALRINGHDDWRLPTYEELVLLADRTRYEPAIDTAFFPDCKSDWYWTSTPVAWRSGARWLVGFGYGDSDANVDGSRARVRAVRSAVPGQ